MEPFPYRIERLSEPRLPDVQRLLAEVLHKKVTLEWLRIKYDPQFSQLPYFSSIAYDGDRPIAFYGAVPQVFSDGNGNEFLACHLADCMTLPAYQRRGLHSKLGTTVYGWMREAGAKIIYGFHSENTYQSSKKLGWEEWGRLRGYAIGAAQIPFSKVFNRFSILRKRQTRRAQRVLAPYAIPSSDFQNSQAGNGFTIVYSKDFFAAKAFHANHWIKINEVKFWLGLEAVVRVGDVHFDTEEEFQAALTILQRLCRKLGYPQIQFQTYPDSPLDIALSQSNQGFESWMVGYLKLSPELGFKQYHPNYGDQDSF